MARPLRIAFQGAFYHVTARGNERKAVFKSNRDREKFLEHLETATERYQAVIHAYCLMDNHYHLLLETPAGNLPQIMHHVNGPYFKDVFGSVLLGSQAFIDFIKNEFISSQKIFLCRKHTTASLAVIGDRFGIGDSAVAQSYSRFLNEIKTDRHLRRQEEKIEKMIKLCNVET